MIVAAGAPAPAPWADAPRIVVDEEVLRDPAATVARLHECWLARTPVVVDLRVEVDELRAPGVDGRAPWALGAAFELGRERLYFLARANNYDARTGTPIWWPAREAQRLGARSAADADVALPGPGATGAFVDGGPRTTGLGVPVVHRWSLEAGVLHLDRDDRDTADPALAPDQRAAVLHAGGAARILAPAGSGKTTVLTARLRHLVADRGWAPASITALAYNVRAGNEMRARLDDLGPAVARRVRTFNSIGYDVLRRAAPDRTVRVLDEREVRARIEPHLSVRFRTNADVLAPYLDALEEVQLALREPARVEHDRGDVPGFAAMFEGYRAGLAREAATDYDGQITGAIEVLLREPAIRAEMQRECRHLLVDEFQDLRPAHLLLLRLLAAPAYDVFGVGDDDQVIYGYSGADPDFLISYDRWFPGAASHPLEVNYRCPPAVVTAATTLLAHNRRRVAKTIHAAPVAPTAVAAGARAAGGSALRVERAAAAVLSVRAVEIVEAHLAAGGSPDSGAVLCRVNAGLLPVQVLLQDRGVPVTAAVGERYLRRTGVAAALAALRLACAAAAGQPLRGTDVAEVARRRGDRVRARTVERIRRGTWTVERLRAHARRIPDGDAERLDDLAGEIAALGNAVEAGAPTAQLLALARDLLGLGVSMGALDRSGRGRDASHVDDFHALVTIASIHPVPATFESWLRDHLRAADDRAPDGADGLRERGRVTLSSVHRVKGMEWDHVIVLGAHDGMLPHRLADDVEEERRIFHVAITRCRRDVVVLADEALPAPFVTELTTPPSEHPAPMPARRSRAGAQSSGRGGKAGPGAPSSPPSPEAQALREALRAWRRARAGSKPAFTVLVDRTLDAIAEQRPSTERELLAIPGIGLAKCEQFGAEILELVGQASDAKNARMSSTSRSGSSSAAK